MNTFDQLKTMQREREKAQENRAKRGTEEQFVTAAGPINKVVHTESLLEVTNNSVPKEKQYSPKLKTNTPVRIQSECPFCPNDEILMGSFNVFGQILKYRCPRCQHSFDSLNGANN